MRRLRRLVVLALGLGTTAVLIHSLLPVVSSVICTAAPTARALQAADLAERVRVVAGRSGHELRTIDVEPEPLAAVERALETSGTVCVGGSIVLVGAVRDALERRAILR